MEIDSKVRISAPGDEEDEVEAEAEATASADVLEGPTTDADAQKEVGMEGMGVETEAKRQAIPVISPQNKTAKVKIISNEDMEALLNRLDATSAWESVLAELETVYVKNKLTGQTLVHVYAGEPSSRRFITHLLQAGIPVDATDKCQATPLMYAVTKGALADCEWLCSLGADLGGVTWSCRRSPLALALEYGHYNIATWLLQHPKFPRKWNGHVFGMICAEHTQFVVPYLNLFAVDLARDPSQIVFLPEKMQQKMKSKPATRHTRSFVYYLELTAIYGVLGDVSETALARVIQTPVACEALGCAVLRHVIKVKWAAFGRTLFVQEMILYSTLLASFSLSVIYNQVDTWNSLADPRQYVTGVSRIVAGVCSCLLLLKFERQEAFVEGVQYFYSFWNLLGASAYVGVIVVVVYQAYGFQSELLQAAIGVLNVALWVNMFQYLQMAESVAVLIAMMAHMVSDVAKFILLYCVFLFGFSGGFYVLLFSRPGYETFIDALITVLLMLFGQINYDPFNTATGLTWIVANLLLLAYLVSVVIVLLNLLIAMMSTSYSNVWGEAEGQVLLSYAQAIIRMEKSLTRSDRKNHYRDVTHDKPKRKQRLWRTVHDVERAYVHAKEVYSDEDYSHARRVLAALMVLLTSCIIGASSLIFGSTKRRHESLSPLIMNAETRCSTLQDGERWELVREKTTDDRQAVLLTRVDSLTTRVEELKSLVERPPTHDKLTKQVEELKSIVERQTALIESLAGVVKDLSVCRDAIETLY